MPKFSIYTNGKKIETLISCHMERQIFAYGTLPEIILGKDNVMYTCLYEKHTRFFPLAGKAEEVIISFQRHTYGSFAVIRPFVNVKVGENV